jgi:NADH-quinone oxidoreductase subunit E
MALLKCQHCDYRWNYEGKNEHYATCPRCRYKVRIISDKTSILHRKKLDHDIKNNFSEEKKPFKLLGIAKIVSKILEEYQYNTNALIQILLRLQNDFGWLPKEMLLEVSKQLKIPLYQVYQATTFYKAFSLAPRGKHIIRVCMGTSCKVRGAQMVLDRIQNFLKIEVGEISPDGNFSIETVNCMGCCALGPAITVDDDYYGNLASPDVKRILSLYT